MPLLCVAAAAALIAELEGTVAQRAAEQEAAALEHAQRTERWHASERQCAQLEEELRSQEQRLEQSTVLADARTAALAQQVEALRSELGSRSAQLRAELGDEMAQRQRQGEAHRLRVEALQLTPCHLTVRQFQLQQMFVSCHTLDAIGNG